MTTTVSPASRTHDGKELPLAGTYDIDVSHTSVGFVARHLMVSKTRGQFPVVSGTITIGDDPADSSVEVSIDACRRRDRRRAARRPPPVGRLLRRRAVPDDLLPQHPGQPGGAGHYDVDGDLTVRGVTQPVRLQVTFEGAVTDPWGNIRGGFAASAEIDREDFGLTWNQVLEGGGVTRGQEDHDRDRSRSGPPSLIRSHGRRRPWRFPWQHRRHHRDGPTRPPAARPWARSCRRVAFTFLLGTSRR